MSQGLVRRELPLWCVLALNVVEFLRRPAAVELWRQGDSSSPATGESHCLCDEAKEEPKEVFEVPNKMVRVGCREEDWAWELAVVAAATGCPSWLLLLSRHCGRQRRRRPLQGDASDDDVRDAREAARSVRR